MKILFKIITVLVLFIWSNKCISQNIQNRAGVQVTVQDARLKGLYNLVVPAYADTIAANVQKGLDSCGAIIFTYDYNGLWFRACYPSKHWAQMIPGGSSSTDTLAWSTLLNTFPGLNSSFGTASNTSIRIVTNNVTRLIYPSGGIVRNNGEANKCLVFDTATKILYYSDCGIDSITTEKVNCRDIQSYWSSGNRVRYDTLYRLQDAVSFPPTINLIDTLTYTVSEAEYSINCNQYTSPDTTLVFDTLVDCDNERIDVIAGNTSGQTIIVKGTESITASPPSLNSNQIALSFVLITCDTSTSAPVTVINIYNSDGALEEDRNVYADGHTLTLWPQTLFRAEVTASGLAGSAVGTYFIPTLTDIDFDGGKLYGVYIDPTYVDDAPQSDHIGLYVGDSSNVWFKRYSDTKGEGLNFGQFYGLLTIRATETGSPGGNDLAIDRDYDGTKTTAIYLKRENGFVGIGNNITSPSATLDIVGTFQYDHSSAAADLWLKSTDADGNAIWDTLPAASLNNGSGLTYNSGASRYDLGGTLLGDADIDGDGTYGVTFGNMPLFAAQADATVLYGVNTLTLRGGVGVADMLSIIADTDFTLGNVAAGVLPYITGSPDQLVLDGDQAVSINGDTIVGITSSGYLSILTDSTLAVLPTTTSADTLVTIRDAGSGQSTIKKIAISDLSLGGGSVPLANSAFVSKSGNDGTGTVGNEALPFLTIQAAITAASSGQTVFVSPGTYAEALIGKDGVNIHFYDGAILADNTATGMAAIYDNNVKAVFEISGRGVLSQVGVPSSGGVFLLENNLSRVTVRAKKIDNGDPNNPAIGLSKGAQIKLYVDSIVGDESGIEMADSAHAYVYGGVIMSDYAPVYANNSSKIYGYNVKFHCVTSDAGVSLRDNSYGEFWDSYLYSTGFNGVDIVSGNARFYNCKIESAHTSGTDRFAVLFGSGSGETAEFTNCQLIAHSTSPYAIRPGTPVGKLKFLTSCWANKPITSNIEAAISYGLHNLQISNDSTDGGHPTLDTGEVIHADQLAYGSLVEGYVPMYDTTTTKPIWSFVPRDSTTQYVTPTQLTAATTPAYTQLKQIISQSSTGDPTVDGEMVNTTGDTYLWAYITTGHYKISAQSGSPFTANKTFVQFSLGGSGGNNYTGYYEIVSDTRIDIYVFDAGVASDDVLINASLNVEIYP